MVCSSQACDQSRPADTHTWQVRMERRACIVFYKILLYVTTFKCHTDKRKELYFVMIQQWTSDSGRLGDLESNK